MGWIRCSWEVAAEQSRKELDKSPVFQREDDRERDRFVTASAWLPSAVELPRCLPLESVGVVAHPLPQAGGGARRVIGGRGGDSGGEYRLCG